MKTRRWLGYGALAFALGLGLFLLFLQRRGASSAVAAASASASTSASTNTAASASAAELSAAPQATALVTPSSSVAEPPRNAHAAGAHGARVVATGAAHRVAQTTGAPAPTAAEPTPTGVEPGADLGAHAAPRASRGIDEKDPYSK